MYKYPTRSEQNTEKIEEFIKDASRETMELRLYDREISILEKQHPCIIIEKGTRFKGNLALFNCTIRKRKK